jgi:integrase/recombinase XerD
MLDLSVVGEESVMVKALRSIVVGPLERFAGGFAAELARQGYSEESAVHQLVLIAHLSRWMVEQDVEVTDLSPSTVGRYVAARDEHGYRDHRSTKALTPLLAYLRGLGVLAWDRPTADSADAVLLRQFREYLVSERGLSAGTAEGYVREVAGFVDGCVRDGGDLQNLQVGAVTGFMVDQSRRVSPKSVQRSATALRALLRYWHVQGITAVSLVGAVPMVANRSRELARGLGPGRGAVERM